MRVLFTILDWGLGHATRSTSIITKAIDLGAEPILASSGVALEYLKQTFPDVTCIEMPEKPVTYNKSGAGLALAKRAVQQTAINKAQHEWVNKQIEAFKITHLISDNVYGAYAQDLPSVIVTHQLGLLAPVGKAVFDKKLAIWLERFDHIWIPDIDGEMSLAGKMTENIYLKKTPQHIGHLSRFEQAVATEKDIPYLAVLSGPEPQRQILEDKIVAEFKENPGQLVLVRGTNGKAPINKVQTYGMLGADELALLLTRAENVICRSGYSSIMDLAALGTNACFIATPQQIEQQYLADRMKDKNWFGTSDQNELAFDKTFNDYSNQDVTADSFEPLLKGFLES